MFIDEQDAVTKLRAIRAAFLKKKAAIEAQVATEPAVAGWGVVEIRRAHQAAVAEAERYLKSSGIEGLLRTRLANLEPNVIARREGVGDIREHMPGALDRALAEVQAGRRTPPDPMLVHLSVRDLEQRAATASLAEVADIRQILNGRAEGHSSETVRTTAGRALHGVTQRAKELAVDRPVVKQRAEEFPRLKQIEEHLGLAMKAIREDCEDKGVAYEAYADVSAARAAGDRRPTKMQRLPDGSTIPVLVDDAPQNESDNIVA